MSLTIKEPRIQVLINERMPPGSGEALRQNSYEMILHLDFLGLEDPYKDITGSSSWVFRTSNIVVYNDTPRHVQQALELAKLLKEMGRSVETWIGRAKQGGRLSER
jgi:hypothetical protein